MKKLLVLMICLMISPVSVRADENVPAQDEDFMKQLDGIKSPFEDGVPKPVPVVVPVVVHQEPPKPIVHYHPVKPKPFVPMEKVVLPKLTLQGVMVGDNMHQAIINDQALALHDSIQGAELVLVSKQGVELLYKGKKFFLPID